MPTTVRDWIKGVALAVILAAGAALFVAVTAHAHGPADWIQRGQYNNAAGQLCCGEQDCGRYLSGTIKQVPGGFEVNATFLIEIGEPAAFQRTFLAQEFIPDAEATPSPDGQFWLCFWGGKRKCFFYPARSS